MAEVYRPVFYVDPTTGKRVKASLPGAVRKKSPTWWIRYYMPDGRRPKVKGYRDRKATEAYAAELERKAIRADAGLIDPTDEHADTPLGQHLSAYVAYLTAKGNTPKHFSVTQTRVQACLDGCKFVRISDVQTSAVLSFLADLRHPKEGDAPNETKKGKSIATANYYLTAIKGFTRWLWKDRRVVSDPLAGVAKLANAETDVRHARRELTSGEFAVLLESTRRSQRAFRYLSGLDRFALYLTAAGTGLRTAELAKLTPANFDLTATSAVVRLQSAYTKNRKEAELPLSAELVNVLRDYIAGKPSDAQIWSGTWSNAASAKMIRMDLAEARKKWLANSQNARIRSESEQTDFLAYRDSAGNVADFHSLRHLYISRIVRSGASPKVAQELARHCDVRLTLGRYAHVGLHDLTATVDALPDLMSSSEVLGALAATGTDGNGQNSLGPSLGLQPAKSRDFVRQSETIGTESPESETATKSEDSGVFPQDSEERPLPDSNRGWRICNPLPYRLAKGPTQ